MGTHLPSPQTEDTAPQFSAHVYCGHRSPISRTAELALVLECVLGAVDVVEQLRNAEGCPASSDELPKVDGIRGKLWLLFEYPESSRAAFVIGLLSVIMNSLVLLRVSRVFLFSCG